jgi:hypothetical protein
MAVPHETLGGPWTPLPVRSCPAPQLAHTNQSVNQSITFLPLAGATTGLVREPVHDVDDLVDVALGTRPVTQHRVARVFAVEVHSTVRGRMLQK